jgi:hypothetical protein
MSENDITKDPKDSAEVLELQELTPEENEVEAHGSTVSLAACARES